MWGVKLYSNDVSSAIEPIGIFVQMQEVKLYSTDDSPAIEPIEIFVQMQGIKLFSTDYPTIHIGIFVQVYELNCTLGMIATI